MAIQAPAKISSFPETPDIGYSSYPSTATQMARAKRARLAACWCEYKLLITVSVGVSGEISFRNNGEKKVITKRNFKMLYKETYSPK